VPSVEAWTLCNVERHRDLIETTPPGRSPLKRSVIESIPFAEISSGTALRFEQDAFAAFDLYVLNRPDAGASYDCEARGRAKAGADAFDEAAVERLTKTTAADLPGATTDALSLDASRDRLAAYRGIDADRLRRHLIEFLEQVVPVADKLDVKLTLHPDDPPRPLFGPPRIASTEEDYAALFSAVPSPTNGMCFWTGSLEVRADRDRPPFRLSHPFRSSALSH